MKWRPSIRLVMPLCMVGVALMVMVIVCVIYSTTATTMFSQLGMSNTLQAMDQVSERLSDSIGQVEDVLREVADGMEDRGSADSRQFDSSLRLSAGAMENLSALLLLDEYGNPVLGLPSAESKKTCRLTSMDWFNQARTADLGETVFSRPHVQNLYPGEYPWVVSVTRKVRYWQDDLPHTGILMADMRLEPLEDICRSVTLGDNGYLYILDDSGNIIYHPEQKLMSLELISEENILSEDTQSEDQSMVLAQTIEGTNWKLTASVTSDDVAKYSTAFISRVTWVVIALTAGVLLVALWLSMRIVQPLTDIQVSMQRIERNLDDNRMSLPEEGFAEYASLAHSYNVMLRRIRGLMQETVDRQEQLRRMEIGALQEQINPHFLYNTLDSIVRVMETGRTPEAIEMVQALAKLFRLSINNGDYFLTVEQEMDYARNYLTIQQVRYKKRFKYELYMDESIKDLPCPKIILQPLIENSLKHGMSDMPGCTLIVRARQEGYNIVLSVEDDGLGIPPEKLKKLQEMLRDDSNIMVKKSRYGIGLRNTNRRIKLLYGSDYGLTIESEVEERTCVTITFPKHRP
mgnify:FL=1